MMLWDFYCCPPSLHHYITVPKPNVVTISYDAPRGNSQNGGDNDDRYQIKYTLLLNGHLIAMEAPPYLELTYQLLPQTDA